jgi:uncharacterized protein with ParB-like and HNH nuclease domain
VETLYSQLNKGTIDLDPGFQRRQAWDDVRKSRLIESLIAGLPIPNIVLADNSKHRGRFLVIDGKQRLLTIKDFLSDSFKLKGLDLRRDLEGKSFLELPTSDREYLENNSIRATVIKNIPDPDFLYVLFFRLNSGSLQLSPQELRRALIGGKTLAAIDEYIEKSENFRAIFGPELDKRMRDSELVLRYIAFDRSYNSYVGDLKKFLDDTVKHFENSWSTAEAELATEFARLDYTLKTAAEIFGHDVFKKWTGDRFERRINRAVFDVVVRFFSDGNVGQVAIVHRDKVVEAFKKVCDIPEFRSAVERTTKSVEATSKRTRIWGTHLADVLGCNYDEKSARIA